MSLKSIGNPASVILALFVSGCASAGAGAAVERTSAGIGDAALSPLEDLNLRRAPIPALLADIQSPYDPVPELNCSAVAAAVRPLNEVLGRDADEPDDGDQRSVAERAGESGADLALDEVASTMSGFIPYRSIVRRATGASAHERRLREAYEKGAQRRAFLKGLGSALGCAPPAAPAVPDPSSAPAPEIIYRGDAPEAQR